MLHYFPKHPEQAFQAWGPTCCAGLCEHLIPKDRGTELSCLRYIKITLSLSIVGHWDNSSITNIRVLGAVGNVPRGGLAQSIEHDTPSTARTGAEPPHRAASTDLPANSHYFVKGYWVSIAFCALLGIFILSLALPLRPLGE